MLLYSFLNFIFGYTLVSVERGMGCEKLLSFLVNKNISFWDMENVHTRAFFKVKPCYRSTLLTATKELGLPSGDITFMNMGLPFIIMRHKLRVGMIIGAFFGVVAVIFSTMFVWKIEVSGNVKLNYAQISHMLDKQGFCEGTFLPGKKLKRIETAVMAENEDVAFIAINMRGTTAKVQVHERVLPGDKEDLTTPVNLVASYPGQIVKTEVVSGETVVKRGDAVTQGQLLVSGVIDSNTVGYRVRRASGKVMASTRHSLEYKIPLLQTEKHYTGKEIKRKSIKILGKYINFFINSGNLYEKYDTIYDEESVIVFDTVELPIYYAVTTYAEYEEREIEIDIKRARELAYDCYASFIGSRKSVSVESENLNEEVRDGYFVLSGTVDCIEDIAQEKIFYYNQEQNTKNDGTNNNV
ncbi:MAG: hypothetical protein E7588_02200 [Ruminococcaceae bacterium]|nr:hypothetical protein [Oscillospiraceae bacterium]